MKPTPAAWTPIATLECQIGIFVRWVTENHPTVFRRLARHVMKRCLPKGSRAVVNGLPLREGKVRFGLD
jgi:hypothetical protein